MCCVGLLLCFYVLFKMCYVVLFVLDLHCFVCVWFGLAGVVIVVMCGGVCFVCVIVSRVHVLHVCVFVCVLCCVFWFLCVTSPLFVCTFVCFWCVWSVSV